MMKQVQGVDNEGNVSPLYTDGKKFYRENPGKIKRAGKTIRRAIWKKKIVRGLRISILAARLAGLKGLRKDLTAMLRRVKEIPIIVKNPTDEDESEEALELKFQEALTAFEEADEADETEADEADEDE